MKTEFLTLDELLSKFENGHERFRNNALFNVTIRRLMGVESPYKIIDDILKANDSTMKSFEDHIKTCASPKVFVLPNPSHT